MVMRKLYIVRSVSVQMGGRGRAGWGGAGRWRTYWVRKIQCFGAFFFPLQFSFSYLTKITGKHLVKMYCLPRITLMLLNVRVGSLGSLQHVGPMPFRPALCSSLLWAAETLTFVGALAFLCRGFVGRGSWRPCMWCVCIIRYGQCKCTVPLGHTQYLL